MAGSEASPTEPDWRRLNRANWDERAAAHLGPRGYDLSALRAGREELGFVEQELGPVEGLKILHLQCHIGTDSCALAQRGAQVIGVDFSPAAIQAARRLSVELGLAHCTRFVELDVYDAEKALAGGSEFDRVFTTWGTICWIPDLRRWAEIIAQFLRPDGYLYFADAHPAALVFDDAAPSASGRPGFYWPYLSRTPMVETDPRDYADPEARLVNNVTHQWVHPLSDVVTALVEAGLRLDWLHEHDGVPWRMFECLVRDTQGFYHWPDKPWLPLAFSLQATKPNMLGISRAKRSI